MTNETVAGSKLQVLEWNPLHEAWLALKGERFSDLPLPDGLPVVGGFSDARQKLCKTYAWAIPDPEAIYRIAEFADGEPVVEMGAGTGYWAKLLSDIGVEITAFDLNPPKEYANTFHIARQYFDVQRGHPEDLADMSIPTLLLCWPPYDTSMGSKCLKHFKGDRLVYIGEGPYGCNGDNEFHDILAERWENVSVHYNPQWSCIHDCVYFYERG